MKTSNSFWVCLLTGCICFFSSCEYDLEEITDVPCNGTTYVTGIHSGLDGTAHDLIRDNDVETYFKSSYDGWQYIEMDLNCIVKLASIRRYMSRNGIDNEGDRASYGEAISYSLDGQKWIQLTSETTRGWSNYNNVQSHIWEEVPYGWSESIKINIPQYARFIRFHWDNNQDALHEIELVYKPAMCHETMEIAGNYPGLDSTEHQMIMDGSINTYFYSSHDNWQFVQFDLNCVVQFVGLRRYMTRDGQNTSGRRWIQGEGVLYSVDGTNWSKFQGTTTTGWESFVNYAPHAWHSVKYGWSPWLKLKEPQHARYIRFAWDGNYDAVNEIELIYSPFY